MTHPVRYSNDKSLLLCELEERQGSTLIPQRVYVHSDKKGFKRLYLLDFFQRIFMFFEDPKASSLGQMFGIFMMSVIILNLIIFIISSLAQFQTQPDSCDAPSCDNHPTLCPGTIICKPEEASWTKDIELACVILFTIEYLARMLVVAHMPPRLADVMMKKKKKNATMASIFTTNRPSSKDELFAYVKAVLEEAESEGSAFARASKRRSNGENDEHQKALESELLNVSPSSSVVTSGKHTIPTDSRQGSGKFNADSSAPGGAGARSGTPLEVVDEGEGIELSERVEMALLNDQAEMGFTADGDDDGFVLGGMNKPIFSSAEGAPLSDRDNSLENFGRHSRIATTPDANSAMKRPTLSEQLAPRGQSQTGMLEEAAKRRLRERRASRIIMHSYSESDGLEDLAAKSLQMDRSHRYTGIYKVLSYGSKVLNIIDLVAILPFYIELIVGSGNASLSVVRVLRLARVFRIFKMGKGSSGVQMLGKTVKESIPALGLLFFFIVLGVILFGALIYFLESGSYRVDAEYPEGAYLIKDEIFGVDYVISKFTSIYTGIYWSVIVTTTTGYGDLIPLTTLGKIISIFCAYYGVLLLALPITVIGNNFDKTLNAQQGRDNEQFIYECLAGITRSLDVEYRARSKLAPVPSSAYKMTLITAIISTFDTTKQTLLKDAISSANREAITSRHRSGKESRSERVDMEGSTAGSRTEHLRKAVEMLEGGSNSDYQSKAPPTSSRSSLDYHQFAAAKRKEAGEGGEIVISASEASGAMYDGVGGMKLAAFKGKENPGSPRTEGGGDVEAATNAQDGEELKQAKKQMTGITWTNMPSMPRKGVSDSKHKKLKSMLGDSLEREKMPARQQLKKAQEELQSAIAGWAELLSEDASPRLLTTLTGSSDSDSDHYDMES